LKAVTGPLAGQTILVVDDSEAVRTALEVALTLQGACILLANGPAEGLAALVAGDIDLVIQDMNFRREATSGEEGVAMFRQIRERFPDVPVVLLTAWTHLETAVDLVRAGAADYIGKPWDEARLLTTVRNLLDLRRSQMAVRRTERDSAIARHGLAEKYHLANAVYASASMHALLSTAAHIAAADVPVLITGPNGAGKEVLADVIQANSAVAKGPYHKVNLGALPDDLLEAELFGNEAGAFTGAKARIGRFETADGGTLFLDEIGNLSAAGQAKLLRVLQSGEFERLGSSQTRRVKVRVVAATNRNLRQAIRDKAFREDLFYRLSLIELEVPALAERREDILPLARHFLGTAVTLAPDAERALLQYSWPGNVRELNNLIRRAQLLHNVAQLNAAHLALPAKTNQLTDAEPPRAEIEAALTRAHGVIAQAARDLGMSRQALYRRMEKLGLKPTDA
jgi:DNA-binding NtrC family response regulator